jgi:hypothetical protein
MDTFVGYFHAPKERRGDTAHYRLIYEGKCHPALFCDRVDTQFQERHAMYSALTFGSLQTPCFSVCRVYHNGVSWYQDSVCFSSTN